MGIGKKALEVIEEGGGGPAELNRGNVEGVADAVERVGRWEAIAALKPGDGAGGRSARFSS